MDYNTVFGIEYEYINHLIPMGFVVIQIQYSNSFLYANTVQYIKLLFNNIG